MKTQQNLYMFEYSFNKSYIIYNLVLNEHNDFLGQLSECTIGGIDIGNTPAFPELDSPWLHIWDQAHYNTHIQGNLLVQMTVNVSLGRYMYM